MTDMVWSYGYFVWSIHVFLLLLRASTENLSQGFFHQFSWGSRPWPHPAFNGQGSPISKHSSWLKTVNSARIGVHKKTQERLLCLLVLKRREMAQPVLANAFLSTASQDSCHVHGTSWLCPPTSLYSTLFASTKPKLIVPTDNMWPKLHGKYTHIMIKGSLILKSMVLTLLYW